MACPNCGAPVTDPKGAFCSRCGHPLSSEETEATGRLDVAPAPGSPESTGEAPVSEPTTELRTDEAAGRRDPQSGDQDAGGPLLKDYATALRTRFLSSWLDPLGAACLAFLVLLALGAVLLVAAKLQYPGFGAGANPIEILSSITILGLAILRAPVHVDDLVISVLPLGALLAAGAGIAWSTSVTLRSGHERRVLMGAAVGVPFALICWLAALVFRFGGKNEVFAGAWGALFWGLVWGTAFGALGALRGTRDRRSLWAVAEEAGRSGVVKRGVAAAGIALTAAAVLGGIATLLWVIVALVKGAPGPRFGAGDAVAAFVYLLAFGPNVIVSLVALGMGAPLYVGARVTVAGSGVGSIDRIWLFGDAPGYAGFLVLIPIVACSLAGFWIRRASKSSSPPKEIGVFAAVFAVTLALLALLGEARLGASLLGRGLARLDVNAAATLGLGILWAAVAGGIGWWLADRAAEENA